MNVIFEKISLTLILLKIFDIYLCHYFATNKKTAITHVWHAIEPQTICHLIVKEKEAEHHIFGKYCNCNTFGVTNGFTQQSEFQSSYYSTMQCVTDLKLYLVIASQKLDE